MTNPIIHRELIIGTLRTRKAFALQLVFVVVLSALVLLKWPTDALVDLSGLQAQQMLRVFGYGLLAAIMLLAPAFPATSIVQEKQQGTLALLLHSPMTRWAVLVGKLVGSMGYMLIILALSLPAAVACYIMGGIDPVKQLGMIYVILLLLSLQYAALGLLVSSSTASADSALRVTYGLVLVLAVVSLGPHFFTREAPVYWIRETVEWIRSLSPIPAMMEAMAQSAVGSAGIRVQVNLAGRFALVSGTLTVVFLLWTAMNLDLRRMDRARPPGHVTDERGSGVRAYRRVMYLWFFDPQRRTEMIGLRGSFVVPVVAVVSVSAAVFAHFIQQEPSPARNIVSAISGLIGVVGLGALSTHIIGANPVASKEARSRRFGRSNWMMRMIGGCLVVSLLLTLATAYGVQSVRGHTGMIGGVLVILQMSLLIMLTPSLASSLISGELETGGWQLLQMTPLTAATIVMGKLLSVTIPLTLVLIATLPGYVVMIYIQPAALDSILQVLTTMVITAVFAILLTATISSFFRRTAPSTTVAYTLLVALVAGTFLIWLGRDGLFQRDFVETMLSLNPLAAAMSLIKAPQFEGYRLVPANWYFMAVVGAACLVVLWLRTWLLTRPS